jgi:hypothetical protein
MICVDFTPHRSANRDSSFSTLYCCSSLAQAFLTVTLASGTVYIKMLQDGRYNPVSWTESIKSCGLLPLQARGNPVSILMG